MKWTTVKYFHNLWHHSHEWSSNQNFSVIFDFSSIVIGQVKKNKKSTGRKKEKEHKKKKYENKKKKIGIHREIRFEVEVGWFKLENILSPFHFHHGLN